MKTTNLLFLSQLKELIGEDESYTRQDDNLRLAIETTTSLIESMTGRKFTKQEFTEYHNAKLNYKSGYSVNTYPYATPSGEVSQYVNWYELTLKQWPIDPIATISIYYDLSGKFENLLDPSNYIVDLDNGKVLIKFPTPNQKRAFKIVYTAGWQDSVDLGVTEDLSDVTQERSVGRAIPFDLRQAALLQASQYAAYMQASLCASDKQNTVFLAGKSFLEAYQINPTTSLILAKYKRQNLRMV